MDEQFNPYFHWLGLADVQQRPDHYALLGLDRFEADPQTIKTAADRATTRVRGFRPGDKARQWAALLDELDEARRCLTDTAPKEHYDEQLRGGNVSASGDSHEAPPSDPGVDASTTDSSNSNGTPGGSSNSPTTSTAPINPAMYPPGLGPAPLLEQPRYGPAGPAPDHVPDPSPIGQAPVGDPSMFAPGYAPQGANPMPEASPDNGPPESQPGATSVAGFVPAYAPGRVPMGRDASASPSHAAAPAGDPMAPMAPMASPAAHDPMAPVGSMTAAPVDYADPMAPMAMPVDASMAYAEATSTAPPTDYAATGTPIPIGGPQPDDSPEAKVTPKEKPLARRSGTGAKLLIAGGGTLAAMAIGVAGLLMFLPKENEPGDGVSVATIGDIDDPIRKPPEPNPPPEEQPEPPPEVADPITPEPEPQPPAPPFTEPPPLPEPEPEPPITITLPQPQPEPPIPEPEPAPEPLTPAEKDELRKALVGAKTAMGDRDQAAVIEHLATATALARSDQHKAMVKRLKELNHYVTEFWRSVDEAYNNLKPQTTIKVRDSEAAIVEVDAQKVILRYSGRNQTFPRDELPSGLAMAIANNWFTDEPVNLVVKGALLFVDPKGRPEEARQLWREAQAAGVDVAPLMPVLDDKYEF